MKTHNFKACGNALTALGFNIEFKNGEKGFFLNSSTAGVQHVSTLVEAQCLVKAALRKLITP
jgi:hypothetical protein